MSTDLRDPASTPPGDRPAPEEKPKPALSLTQVVGGALAAMTAAALGSRLSVAGTVVGAALASVVAAVAGAVYTSSLRRTSKTVSTVWKTRVRPDGHGGTETVVEEVTADGTTVLPRTGVAGEPAGPAPATNPRSPDAAPTGARRLSWKTVAVAALAMFVVAAVALTGLELATGRSLSGGTGTTVGQVADGGDKPSPRPTPSGTRSPSATASASPTGDAPSAAPSGTASTAPSTAPSTQPSPTPTRSAEPSATPSSAPSATPGTSAGPAAPGGAATP